MLLNCTWIAVYWCNAIMSRRLAKLRNVCCHSHNTYKVFSGRNEYIWQQSICFESSVCNGSWVHYSAHYYIMIWDVTLYCLHGRYQCFKWTCCLLLQGTNRKEQLPLKTTVRSVISQKALNLSYRVMYRVSIKSFPDYKNLLQENYCTWNTKFFFFKM
jgi:hypothetical protein